MKTVWIYTDTSKQVGDVDRLKVFESPSVFYRWKETNDAQGIAFEHVVIESGTVGISASRPPDPPGRPQLVGHEGGWHELEPCTGPVRNLNLPASVGSAALRKNPPGGRGELLLPNVEALAVRPALLSWRLRPSRLLDKSGRLFVRARRLLRPCRPGVA